MHQGIGVTLKCKVLCHKPLLGYTAEAIWIALNEMFPEDFYWLTHLIYRTDTDDEKILPGTGFCSVRDLVFRLEV